MLASRLFAVSFFYDYGIGRLGSGALQGRCLALQKADEPIPAHDDDAPDIGKICLRRRRLDDGLDGDAEE